MLDINHDFITIYFYNHLHRIARVRSLPLYIPYFGAEYMFASRLKQYHRCVVKSILIDANSYTGVLDDLGNVHVYR